MRLSIGSEAGRQGFDSTQWSLVLAARDSEPLRAHAALSFLCATYWRPLYSFVRRNGYSAEDAQDLTQGFFAHLLDKHGVEQVDPSFGRFRAFLLASIKNFLANECRRNRALKRGGAIRLISLDDMAEAECVSQAERTQTLTPERVYEREWALALLGRAAARLEAEFTAAGKSRILQQLKPYLTGDDGAPYSEAALSLGMNEVAIRVSVHRMRGRFRDLLQREIGQTLSDPGDSRSIEQELRFLLAVL